MLRGENPYHFTRETEFGNTVASIAFLIFPLWNDLTSCSGICGPEAGIPQGVYSHGTSLSLHELSDANPSQLHMTVPISFRRTAGIPRVLVCGIDQMSHAKIPKRYLGCFARPHSARFLIWWPICSDRIQQSPHAGRLEEPFAIPWSFFRGAGRPM